VICRCPEDSRVTYVNERDPGIYQKGRRALGIFGAVLNNLSEQVGYCHRRAGECRELVKLATSPSDKTLYIEREQNWLMLARSYELQERTALFAKELPRPGRYRSGAAPSCPSCMAPTRICWSTILVCTNCGCVVEDQ
jgi:hypothetical protein